jgi:hypothetical protein
MFADDFPDPYTISVFGQAWTFSHGALKALETRKPITDSHLEFAATLMLPAVETAAGAFEVDYYGLPLRGEIVDGVVKIDA